MYWKEQPDSTCPICGETLAAGVRVGFDGDEMVHLACFSKTEGTATVVRNFLVGRPTESFCYTCLVQHLTRDRQEIEKATTALRVTRDGVVVKHGFCATCDHLGVTFRAKPVR
jgi:hypothetical protein